VPQQVEFFNATVAENIARLGPVDSEKVVEAAKMAGIHESLLRLPKGYDTPLGERGFPLSGGQRQRVAIARAFYLGEQILMRAIQLLKSRGSCFVVTTHRPRLVGVVDRIVMINEGRQVAYGNTKDILDVLNQQRLDAERQRKERAAALKVVGTEGALNG
jgi:ABC-type protease/lipase transport system fused ATPase/permease subunit